MTDTVLRLSGVAVGWDGRQVLSDVNLGVNRGDLIAITGPNGGGKTTLMRVVLGLVKPDSGTVEHPSGRLTVGYLPQKNQIDSRFPVTVDEVIAQGLLSTPGLSRSDVSDRLDAMLDLVELRAHRDKAIGTVSGGQLQRALLGRALIARPEMLVLDEPLSYLDKHFEQRVYDIVGDLRGKATILLVSHEMTTIAAMANRHLIVNGTVSECHAHHHAVHYDCDPC